jgi:hypothetical protein
MSTDRAKRVWDVCREQVAAQAEGMPDVSQRVRTVAQELGAVRCVNNAREWSLQCPHCGQLIFISEEGRHYQYVFIRGREPSNCAAIRVIAEMVCDAVELP